MRNVRIYIPLIIYVFRKYISTIFYNNPTPARLILVAGLSLSYFSYHCIFILRYDCRADITITAVSMMTIIVEIIGI